MISMGSFPWQTDWKDPVMVYTNGTGDGWKIHDRGAMSSLHPGRYGLFTKTQKQYSSRILNPTDRPTRRHLYFRHDLER